MSFGATGRVNGTNTTERVRANPTGAGGAITNRAPRGAFSHASSGRAFRSLGA